MDGLFPDLGRNSSGFLKDFSERRLAVLQDDSVPPFRAILLAPAQDMTGSAMNELLTLSGGLTFVALSSSRAQAFMLGLMRRPSMVPDSPAAALDDSDTLASCESVEAREGVTTGISAADRALTVAVLGEAEPAPRKLVKPGHIFPIQTRSGGVLVRHALPEGALDIVKLAGFTDAALFADCLNSRGDFMTPQECNALCRQHHIPFLSLSSLILLRLEAETLVYKVAEAKLPTRLAGELSASIYKCKIHDGEHLALTKGEINSNEPVLTRVQPEFTFGDVFGGQSLPTRALLHRALKAIGERGRGVLVYLRRPAARQLKEQIDAWHNKAQPKTASLMRDYGLGAQILRDLGVRQVELLTATHIDLVGLKSFGLEIVLQRPIPE